MNMNATWGERSDRFRNARANVTNGVDPNRTRARLRGVGEEDLPRLARLDREVFGDDPYPYFAVRQLFDVHGSRIRVIEDDAGLCGYVLLATARDGDHGWILSLGTVERCRGRGYARRLLAEALAMATADGVRGVSLTVAPDNLAAIKLYESFGFAAGEVHADYLGPGEPRIVMSRDLP